ncbi:flagellar hook-associated protein 3 [Ectothiorhodospira sp. PHS-1]|uniref:flagellar hook-associated protein FlgL n=1 Tax=Ectothiorhodospira sp. PHS-1 TaxID=519989 RepID=UPI00024A82F6|nr:flagellar hook-associated protein FlgL [Ectothiorhodospira sp. PHS-1]EHQ52145.1 flagellar hook-associated protein 3 [Ectothiorhodospira sp. PHS-1]
MRISTSQMFQNGIDVIQRRQQELAKTQNQLSTGRRILRPSDDPSGSVQTLKFESSIERTEQYQRNATLAEQRLRLTESTLGGVTDGLQRIRELTVRANNGTETDETRRYIAAEMRQVLAGLVDLANARDANGEYIFSGYASDARPFDVDIDAGNYAYSGADMSREVDISPVRRVNLGNPGGEVFGDGASNTALFEEIGKLILTLEDPAAFQAAGGVGDKLTELDQSLGRILDIQATLGARLNGVETQENLNAEQILQLETTLSQIRDLDYAEAISRFSLQQVSLQAAQQTYVQVQRLSLFDYLR